MHAWAPGCRDHADTQLGPDPLPLPLNLHRYSKMDPSDPSLKGENTNGEFYCALCAVSVGPTSKHCRSCNRCVEGFDHHCKWLNNDIGLANYGWFFGSVSSTVGLLVVQVRVLGGLRGRPLNLFSFPSSFSFKACPGSCMPAAPL